MTFSITLPATVYRAVESAAGGNLPEWIEQMLIEYVEVELPDTTGQGRV